MKLLIASLLLIAGAFVQADSFAPIIKSWKTFKSDVGYEFKYPDCWEVGIDNANEEGPLRAIKSLNVLESEKCPRKRFHPDFPNGVSFSGGQGSKDSKEVATKEIAFREKNAPNDVQRKKYLVFKKIKLGDADAIAWVNVWVGYIQWEAKVYCPDWWISVAGPSIKNENIDASYYEKFKQGDLALPEPEKTIIESIRCIPAKLKANNATLNLYEYSIKKLPNSRFPKWKIELAGKITPLSSGKIDFKWMMQVIVGGNTGYQFADLAESFKKKTSGQGDSKKVTFYQKDGASSEVTISDSGEVRVKIEAAYIPAFDLSQFKNVRVSVDQTVADAVADVKCDATSCSLRTKKQEGGRN